MRGPFNMLRACFILLAVVIGAQIATTMLGGVTCFYLFIVRQAELGSCAGFTAQVREMWAEALAAVLALLLAARSNGPPNPPPD